MSVYLYFISIAYSFLENDMTSGRKSVVIFQVY